MKLFYKTLGEAVKDLADYDSDTYAHLTVVDDWANGSNSHAMMALTFINSGGLRNKLEARLRESPNGIDVTPKYGPPTYGLIGDGLEKCAEAQLIRIAALYELAGLQT